MNRTSFLPSDITSFHWVKFNGSNNQVMYVLSGIILVNMQGNTTADWLGLHGTCKINIPELPAGYGFYIRYHAPYASLNSIYNHHVSNNSGFSVNECNLADVRPNGQFGSRQLTLAFDLAARDSDAFIYRVGFNITISGEIRPLPPVIPCEEEQNRVNELLANKESLERTIEFLPSAIDAEQDPWRKRQLIQWLARSRTALQQCIIDLAEAQKALTTCQLSNDANVINFPDGIATK